MGYSRFSKYAWFLILYNMFVIVWGTIVRATGSGAGCGNHWPHCNGEILPTIERLETVIEFVHRLTSGLDGLLVIALVVWAFRLQPVQRFVRRMSVMSLIFIIVEGMLGAALVRFELVEDNASTARAIMIGLHLVNTLVLLGFLTLTAWSASRPKAKESIGIKVPSNIVFAFVVAILLFWIMSAAGAITALGDTLFPSETLVEGIQQDLSPTAHFLIRLRVWHPIIAIASSIYFFALGWFIQRKTDNEILETRINWLFIIICLQIGGGFLNVALLAPLWMQIFHLLVADSLWILLVVITAETLTSPEMVSVQSSITAGD